MHQSTADSEAKQERSQAKCLEESVRVAELVSSKGHLARSTCQQKDLLVKLCLQALGKDGPATPVSAWRGWQN